MKAYPNSKAGRAQRGFDMIVSEAKRIGRPLFWKDDLFKHDKGMILENSADCFIWGVRECGTFLFYPGCTNKTVEHVRAIERVWPQPVTRWYHYDCGRLHKIGVKRALELAWSFDRAMADDGTPAPDRESVGVLC